jgi:hypothetical protein
MNPHKRPHESTLENPSPTKRSATVANITYYSPEDEFLDVSRVIEDYCNKYELEFSDKLVHDFYIYHSMTQETYESILYKALNWAENHSDEIKKMMDDMCFRVQLEFLLDYQRRQIENNEYTSEQDIIFKMRCQLLALSFPNTSFAKAFMPS